MHTSPFRRAVVSLVAVVTVLAALGAPAHAEETGTITGRFTDNGAPAPDVIVSTWPLTGGFGASALTGSNGEYQIPGLRPGGPPACRWEAWSR